MDIYHAFRIGISFSYNELIGVLTIMNKILKEVPQEISREHLKKIYTKQILKYCLHKKKHKGIIQLIKSH